MLKERIELLSPVGTFDCLQAAIKAGAYAVYFRMEQLKRRVCSFDLFPINDM